MILHIGLRHRQLAGAGSILAHFRIGGALTPLYPKGGEPTNNLPHSPGDIPRPKTSGLSVFPIVGIALVSDRGTRHFDATCIATPQASPSTLIREDAVGGSGFRRLELVASSIILKDCLFYLTAHSDWGFVAGSRWTDDHRVAHGWAFWHAAVGFRTSESAPVVQSSDCNELRCLRAPTGTESARIERS
jgi:hypothetical protein